MEDFLMELLGSQPLEQMVQEQTISLGHPLAAVSLEAASLHWPNNSVGYCDMKLHRLLSLADCYEGVCLCPVPAFWEPPVLQCQLPSFRVY